MAKTGPAQLTAHRRSLDALTGIRLCAAAYVIAYHSKLAPDLAAHGYRLLSNFLDNGYEAVAVFFLLSGFILAYTYTGQISGWSSYRRFWEARFARIWPVYAVSLLLISAVERFFPKPAEAAAVLFMLQSWDPLNTSLAGTWNFVCWTLSCEAFFYLLFPFLYPRIAKLQGRFQLGLLAVLFCVIAGMNFTRDVVGYMPDTLGIPWLPLAVLRLPEFLAGVTLGSYYSRTVVRANRSESIDTSKRRAWLSYTGAIICLVLLCHQPWRWSSMIIIPAALLIFGLASEKTALSGMLSTRWMVFGGGLSYSLYLVQIPAKDIAIWLANRFTFRSSFGLFTVMAFVLFFMSWILFVGVERPSRDEIRSFFAGKEARRERQA